MPSSSERNPPKTSSKDLLKILLATDSHLGHLENDPIRGDDSFIAFEEILQSAKDQKVDMILLGGNLFDKNRPSRRTIWKTMKLLRTYCMGEGNIGFRIMSDQNQNFPNSFGGVNYEDANYNVAIPVFSVHGNNDDPAGGGGLCALEILSMANLVNYFGKSESVDDGVTVSPILIEKGLTRFALYGLGWIRDERLHATFQERKVSFCRPPGDRDDWFSLMVLHQNRISHSHDRKSYVDESMLENFLDFVLWGKEHECLVSPQQSSVRDFYICQPGAPIVTSLCEGESKQKCVAILEIKHKEFRVRQIPLKNSRPFVMESLLLKPNGSSGSSEDVPSGLDTESVKRVTEFLVHRVEELIEKATELPYGKEKLPLVRLQVEYEGNIALPNPHRISSFFVGKIANPNEVLLLKRRRGPSARPRREGEGLGGGPDGREEDVEEDRTSSPSRMTEPKIGDVIESFIQKEMDGNLCLHNERDLNTALSEFVDKLDSNSFLKCVRKSLSEAADCVQKTKEFRPSASDGGAVRDILALRKSLVGEGSELTCQEMKEGDEGDELTTSVEDEPPKQTQKSKHKPSHLSDPTAHKNQAPPSAGPPKRKAAAYPGPAKKRARKASHSHCLEIVASSVGSLSSSSSLTPIGVTTTPTKRKRIQSASLPEPSPPPKKFKAPFQEWDSQQSLMDNSRSQTGWGQRKKN